MVSFKNHYQDSFLACIWLGLKRHHILFTGSDRVTMLKYDSPESVPEIWVYSQDM